MSVVENWKSYRLADLATFHDEQRVPIKSEERASRRGDYPYYGASGQIDVIDDYIFDGDYVLLAEDGANILDRNSPIAFHAKGKFWVNNHAHILKANENTTNEYLVYALESIRYEKYNTGSAQPKLNRDICENIKLFMPPKAEQQKIVEILSDCDTVIDKIECKKQNLAKIAKHYETEFLNKPMSVSSWAGESLCDVLIKRNEVSIVSDEHEVYTSSRKGIFKQTEYFSKQVASEDNTGYGIIRKGDFTYRAMTDDDVFAFNLFNDEVGIVSPAYSVFSAKECDNTFLRKLLNCSRFAYELKKVAQGGTRKSLKFSSLTSIKLNLPDYSMQQKIGAVFSEIDMEALSLNRQLALLKKQKRGLMQQLLTGKLRVKGAA